MIGDSEFQYEFLYESDKLESYSIDDIRYYNINGSKCRAGLEIMMDRSGYSIYVDGRIRKYLVINLNFKHTRGSLLKLIREYKLNLINDEVQSRDFCNKSIIQQLSTIFGSKNVI